jgi:energy-coupling factor transport system permease protein
MMEELFYREKDLFLQKLLVTNAGATILWQGPRLPVFGKIAISLEAVFYGAVMSLRLLDVISVFCLYNIMVHPDKVLNMLERFAFKSALVLSLATRMFPAMIRHLENIKEIQLVRGVDFAKGTFKQKLDKYVNLIYILLLSSLEDSMEIAEAMQARAFGSGRRTCFVRDAFKPEDFICTAAGIAALFAGIYGAIKGYGTMSFYPYLGPVISRGDISLLAFLLGMLSIPALLSWGWRHCRYFK